MGKRKKKFFCVFSLIFLIPVSIPPFFFLRRKGRWKKERKKNKKEEREEGREKEKTAGYSAVKWRNNQPSEKI
jgi:hypothetical protein